MANYPRELLIRKLRKAASAELLSRQPVARRISASTKRVVWERDEGTCKRCGSKSNLHFDHIIPFSLGGGNSPKNIQLLCERCNLRKRANIFDEGLH